LKKFHLTGSNFAENTNFAKQEYRFCETRVPILNKIDVKPKNKKEYSQKSYSDVDFFGWKVSDDNDGYDICFGEVKVRGKPKDVNVYIDGGKKNFIQWLGPWAKSYKNIKAYFQEEGNGYLNDRLHKYLGFGPREVKNVNIAFVGSIWIGDIGDLLKQIEDEFAKSIYKEYIKDLSVPLSKDNITSTIRPTFCVISDLVKYCKNDINNGYTKRYGDVFFDIIREIKRYQNPSLLEATQTHYKYIRNEIEAYTNEEIIKMFNMEIPAKTSMQCIFGTHPLIKVIDTLASNSDSEYNLTELAKSASVSKSTVIDMKEKLLHFQIMTPTKKSDKIQRYKFESQSPTGKLLNELSRKLADIDVEQLVKEWEHREPIKERIQE
jgi:predicted transcriptional regulator